MPEFFEPDSSVRRMMTTRQGSMITVASHLVVLLTASAACAGAPFVPMAHYSSAGAALYTATGDISADGKADVFASNSNGIISVLLGNGNGSFQAPKTIVALPAGSYPIVAADFNRDGF